MELTGSTATSARLVRRGFKDSRVRQVRQARRVSPGRLASTGWMARRDRSGHRGQSARLVLRALSALLVERGWTGLTATRVGLDRRESPEQRAAQESQAQRDRPAL
jgi:hypothetical protein